MLKERKYELVDELAKSLEEASTLIVADYRGLTVADLEELRAELSQHGARFRIVKNRLTLRAAEKAGVEELNEFLTGPTAIAFIKGGDMIATAKTLVNTAKQTQVMSLKGGILDGERIDAEAVAELAKVPPFDVLQSIVVGVVAAPLTHLVSLLAAPLRDGVGVLDARIRQLEEQGEVMPEPEPAAEAEPGPEAEAEPAAEPAAELEAEAEPAAEADSDSEPEPDTDAEPATGAAEAETDASEGKEDEENGDN